MSEQTVDLVVLGGGSGGYAAALRAAELGMTVVMIEKDKVGGTCLHRGCIPTKALLHSAETADVIKEAAQFGVHGSFDRVEMTEVNSYKDKVVEGLFKGLTGLVASRKIEVVQGHGKLVSPTAVEVDGRTIEAGHVLLATGSVPRSIPGLEVDHERVINSDDALKLDTIPGSVVILGAGAIGCEFASVWRSFGAEVTIVEALPHLVPLEEESSSKLLERAFRKRGIKQELGARFEGWSAASPASSSRSRAARRSRRTCCWSPSDAGRCPRTSATSRSASRWTAASSRSTRTARPASPRSARSATSSRPCSWRTSASPRASWWPSGWPGCRSPRSTTTASPA
jgi:pyruvate/2-oxoglutarate dehydrogenase complex dihydrolipoamide dehydrogenase (E3) component